MKSWHLSLSLSAVDGDQKSELGLWTSEALSCGLPVGLTLSIGRSLLESRSLHAVLWLRVLHPSLHPSSGSKLHAGRGSEVVAASPR